VADHVRAVALVEPLRLGPDLAGGGLAALDAHQEHPHGVGQLLAGLGGLVHLVAPLGRAEVGQAGAGQHQVGGIGMVDRGQHPALGQGGGDVDLGAERRGLCGLGQGGAGRQGGVGQGQQGVDALDLAGQARVIDRREDSRPALFLQLHEPQHHGCRYLPAGLAI